MADESTRQDRDKTSDQSLFVIGRMTSALESFTASFNRIEKLLDTQFKGQQTERKTFRRNEFDFDRLGKSLTGDLKENISELNDTYKKLQRSTKQLSEDWKSYSRGKEFGTSYLRSSSAEKLINERIKELEKLNKELEKTRAGQSAKVSDKHQEITQQLHDKSFDVSKRYKEELQKFKREISKVEASSLSDAEKKERKRSIGEKIKSLKEDTKSEQKSIDKQLKDSFQTAINEIVEELEESVEKVNRDFSKKQEENNKVWESIQSTIDYLESSIRNADEFSNSLGQSSKSYATWLEKRARKEETQADKMRSMISDAQKFFSSALDAIDETINELNEKLQNDLELSEDQKENIKKQIENANKQKKNIEAEYEYWKDAKPSTQILKDAGKSLFDAGKTIAANIGKSALKYIEDRYLTAYKEGFNTVYQSIESTRNSVSARLKLDQGGFSDLQDNIQQRIEESGYEGTITQSDVNEAIVSLSQAGVTDKSILESLAFEQSKLTALESSFNLNNEETIQRLMEQYQAELASGSTQEQAMNSLINMLDTATAMESQIRDTMGDAGLVNNQADQILNQVLDISRATNRTTEEATDFLTSSMYAANQAYYAGLDPNVFMSILKDFETKGITEYGTFQKILALGDMEINPETFASMNPEDIYQTIAQAMMNIARSDIDENYLAEYMKEYGLTDYIDVGAIKRLRSSSYTASSFVNTDISDEMLEETSKSNDLALQQSTYLSKTESYQNKAQNSMAKLANDAEKLYKGNDIVSAGFSAVEEGITALEDIGMNILRSMFTQGFGSDFLSSGAGSFLTGGVTGSSDKLAALGKGAGIAAGVGIAGYAIYNDIQNGEAWNEIVADDKVISGVATSIGSAIAGPIGGAIAGVSTQIGHKIYDSFLKESIESLDDPITTAANALTDAAVKQAEAADKQITTIENELNSYRNYSLTRKKLMLGEKANNLSEEEINKLFEETVILQKQNELEKQKNLKTEAEILEAQAPKAAGLEADLAMDEYEQQEYERIKEMSAEDIIKEGLEIGSITQDELEEYNNRRKEALKDGGVLTEEMQKKWALEFGGYNVFDPSSKDAYQTYIANMGASDVGAISEEILATQKEMEEMSIAQLRETAKYYGLSGVEFSSPEQIKQAVISHKLNTHGLQSVQSQDVALSYASEVAERKKDYDKHDKKFGDKWEKTFGTRGIKQGYSLEDMIYEYADKNNIDITKADAIARGVSLDADKNVHLYTYNGLYNPAGGYEGKYKSGLTSVPHDNYLALLHEGERVLTAQEAEAYNEMSSYAVSNLAESINNYGNSSNVFNTNSYGLGNFETSINNQTQSISSILNQILSAINHLSISVGGSALYTSAGKASLLRGNSNLTQINTM